MLLYFLNLNLVIYNNLYTIHIKYYVNLNHFIRYKFGNLTPIL